MTAGISLREMRAVERLAARDTMLFADPDVAEQRLGWTASPALASDEAAGLAAFAATVAAEGITDVVLLGMGGSSLAPLVLTRSIGPVAGRPRLHVLDTTSPDAVRGVLDAVDPETTLVVVSSKSGTTIEPRALADLFFDHFARHVGALTARHFVAVTDPGTDLEVLALAKGFRRVFLAPPDVGGRYAALTPFGTVPAALAGVDIARLASSAVSMETACESVEGTNPGEDLADWLLNCASAGRDKLTFIASPRLEPFGLWVEQLVAESTGKGGAGLLPVLEAATDDHATHGPDRMTFLLRAEDDEMSGHALLDLADDEPRFEVIVKDPHDLGGEFVRWEWAVALFSAAAGIEPFDQPNVAEAKAATEAILQGSPADAPGPLQTALALAAGSPADGGVDAATAIDDLLSGLRAPRYLAILAYLPERDDLLEPLRAAAAKVSAATGVAVTLELGPRYLHSTGQYHKGGPANGAFIVVTAGPRDDVPLAGREYTLGGLHRAQAQGDVATLVSRGLEVVHVDLPAADVAHVGTLAAIIRETVLQRR